MSLLALNYKSQSPFRNILIFINQWLMAHNQDYVKFYVSTLLGNPDSELICFLFGKDKAIVLAGVTRTPPVDPGCLFNNRAMKPRDSSAAARFFSRLSFNITFSGLLSQCLGFISSFFDFLLPFGQGSLPGRILMSLLKNMSSNSTL